MKTESPVRVFSGAPWESLVGYCRAVRSGNFVAVSGTTSVGDDGQPHGIGDPYAQAKRCLEIIERSLRELGGFDRTSIVRTRMFVSDISLWKEFGRAHAEFFEESPPATSMLEVKALIGPDFLIEIEADAVCE